MVALVQKELDKLKEEVFWNTLLCNHQKTSRTIAEGATSLEVLQAKMAKWKRELVEAQMDAETREDRAFTTRRVKSCRKRMRAAEKVFESADVATCEAAKEEPDFSLRTSRLHYVDPRITVSWCRAHQVPIERVRPDSNVLCLKKQHFFVDMISLNLRLLRSTCFRCSTRRRGRGSSGPSMMTRTLSSNSETLFV